MVASEARGSVVGNTGIPEAAARALPALLGLTVIGQSLAECYVEAHLTALERGGLIAKRFSAPSEAEGAEAVPSARSEDEVQRYLQAQQLVSDAINQHLGFRGYGLMMRLQKTANIRDLHDLLPDFAKALVKRIGMGPATPIVEAIERLIARQ